MIKNYIDADQKFVGSVVLYATYEEKILYEDAEHTTLVNEATARKLFMAGQMIVDCSKDGQHECFCKPIRSDNSYSYTCFVGAESVTFEVDD